ncbi:hypothetical protein R3W88_002091 [Solanum pinnatisectum]|uniref:Uncharacterized protein n=1 Tax=Solanum pinnatisectum TaxID=50273 RepID=A0AAV9MN00_9SOLN|nr:hypothetical protein R3W88_002091 [Solanum pinnatisectum]
MSPGFMMVVAIVGVLICGINGEKNYGRKLLEDCAQDDDQNSTQTDQPVLVPYGVDLTQVRDQGNSYITGEPIDPDDLARFNNFHHSTQIDRSNEIPCDDLNKSDTPTLDGPTGVAEPLLTSDQNSTQIDQSNQIPFGVDLTEVPDQSNSNTFDGSTGFDEYF